MPHPVRKSLPHSPPLWVRTEEAIWFITINCRSRGQNHLCVAPIASALLDSVHFRHDRGDWWAHVFLLMPDHLHTLLSFPPNRDMVKIVRDWKHYTAVQFGIEWQRDFFDHRLRHDESLREKIDYILANPVRKGLVAVPENWPHVWRSNLSW